MKEIPCVPSPCPLCGAQGPHPVLQAIRHLSPFNPGIARPCRIQVVRCTACGLMRLDPRPDDTALAAIQKHTLGDAADVVGSFEAGNTNPAYAVMLSRELLAAGFPVQGGRILDAGCGSGDLVSAVAGRLEAHATGLEMSEGAIARARERFPRHHWVCGVIEAGAVPEGAYDAVTLIHVLEHLPHPVDALRACLSWLKPGGVLVVEVPNAEFYFSAFYTLFLETPKPLLARLVRLRSRVVPFTSRGFYPYHLTLFGRRPLAAMAERAGFRILASKPSTCRLERWVWENRRGRRWLRLALNHIKLGLARTGLPDNLLLVAQRPT